MLGLALDVGTTTIAAYLADLTTGNILATESALNPQVTYGDDIIARLQYAAHHAEGAHELQKLVTAGGRSAGQASRASAAVPT